MRQLEEMYAALDAIPNPGVGDNAHAADDGPTAVTRTAATELTLSAEQGPQPVV
jgi:hypothetical protein